MNEAKRTKTEKKQRTGTTTIQAKRKELTLSLNEQKLCVDDEVKVENI